MKSTTHQILKTRLSSFRSLLKQKNLNAFVVPHNDAHFSEYICARDERLAFISGFDGSAGCAVITETEALLWTDGRYFQQASQQLPDDWTLMRQGVSGVPSTDGWLTEKKFGAVGVDPWLMDPLSWKRWRGNGAGINAVGVNKNPVDEVWGADMPGRPARPIREHLLEYAGRSRGDKLASLRSEMEKHDVDLCLVCALDEICWVLNLRGDDIPYNPVFFGWLLVSRHMPPVLYCDVAKIEGDHHAGGAAASANGAGPGPAAQQHANGSTTSPPPLDRLQLKPYAQILPDLKAIRDGPKWRVWCDAGGCPAALYEVMENPLEGIEIPIKNWKGVKNSVELAGMRAAHVRDGAAKTKFLMWLEDQFRPRHGKSGTTILTEVSVATKLEELRRQNERFAGLSFGTISGSGPNGAIIHYHPEGEVPVQRGTLYLVDSGAQYLDGTTDVTRTVYIQPDEDKQRAGDDKLDLLSRDYTLVLQGHIALATAVFPTNTPGAALDVLARLPLWKQGWNYNHGTGHGVGAHLNVHEGPHGIPWLRTSLLKSRPEVLANGLVPGMICSNEPGFYVEGQYGIRIENLVEVVTVEDERSGTSGRSVGSGAGERRAASGTTGGADIGVALPAGSGATGAFSAHSSFPPEEQHPYYKRDLQYCCFRNLTFVPLDKKLIEVAMLTTEERAYVDGYHAECYAKLAPFFAEDKTGNDYHRARLREMCAPLEDASKDDVSRANVAMKRRRVAV